MTRSRTSSPSRRPGRRAGRPPRRLLRRLLRHLAGAAGVALLVAAGTAPGAHAAPDEGVPPQGPAPDAAVGDPTVVGVTVADAAAAGTSLGAGAGVGTAVPTAARGWGWPLAGEPAVGRPFVAPVQRWSPGHRGVDLVAAAGVVVLAPADGVVGFAGTVVDRGVVVLEHQGDLRTTLEPVLPLVPVGAVVRRGEPVAELVGGPELSGGHELSGGPELSRRHCPPGCLHWGVRRGRGGEVVYLDPLGLLGPPAPPVLLPLVIR